MFSDREAFEIATATRATSFTAVRFRGSAQYDRFEFGSFKEAVECARREVTRLRPMMIYGIANGRQDVLLATVQPDGTMVPCKTKKGTPMTKYLLEGEVVAQVLNHSDDEFELTSMRSNSLKALHNEHADKPVDRFSDHEAAVRRTAAVLKEKIGMAKKASAEKSAKKSTRASGAKLNLDAKIYPKVEANPIRESATKTHPMFQVYLRSPGLKVSTALEKGVGRADMLYHLKKGWIELKAE